MHITYLSIFPELFDSFCETTLISRAVENQIIEFETINPRHFTDDRHRTVDDEIYGWGHGLLMKAQPIIDGIKHRLSKHSLDNTSDNFQIIIPGPSTRSFVQKDAHDWSESDFVLFICGRYEWIDARVYKRLHNRFPDQAHQVSLGQFVTLGGELPAMTMTEAIVRLLPGVIHDPESRKQESYNIHQWMSNIEHPQYTRPQVVERMRVPDILLSWDHKKIEERKKKKSKKR